jgi:rubrerythrin
MTPQEIDAIFSLATKRELEAHEFYQKVAKRAKDAEVRRLFAQLAKEELGHYEMLERFQADPSLPMKIAAPAADFKVAEATELPPFTDDLSPKDAIALAMKKEQQAVEFYRTLAAGAADAGTRDLFENLANTELGHKQRLENAFVDIGYPEAF